ncbi:HNH endonuclease [Paenibacillus sp. SI8]|uniref:HNH endonuclease n=1 Tax=unclassified Paenibacillus TaxID=185978 RepID=UPI0034660256
MEDEEYVEINKMDKDRILFFMNNYDLITKYELVEDRICLGEITDENTCRFCGKGTPEVSFKTIAHAIPEFIGNRLLFSSYECDTCNGKFGRSIENHFANFLGIARTLSQIKGKKGIPSYKKGNSRIDVDKVISVKTSVNDPIYKLDQESHVIDFEGFKEPFIPAAAYKCLVKMAISIMPEEEVQHYRKAVKWILEEDLKECTYPHLTLQALRAFSPVPSKSITNLLFRRKEHSKDNVFYMIYVVIFSSYMYQIYLPLSPKDDSLIGKDIVIAPFPAYLNSPLDESIYEWRDFTNYDLVKDEPITIRFRYESETAPI